MRFFLCWGFGIWFVASAVFRFIGHYFFTIKEPLLMIATYILAFPIVWLATIPIYSIKKNTRYRAITGCNLHRITWNAYRCSRFISLQRYFSEFIGYLRSIFRLMAIMGLFPHSHYWFYKGHIREKKKLLLRQIKGFGNITLEVSIYDN